MKEQEIKQILEQAGAILQGHFKLSSGLHSEMYIQCAKLFMHANYAETLCKALAEKVSQKFGANSFDAIISPAMGGIIVGYELSRHLNVPNIFCERVNGVFELRRGFTIEPGMRLLVAEDVITTGKSSQETFDLVQSLGGKVIGEASIINRSKSDFVGTSEISLVSLLNLDIATYQENQVPEHLQKIPVVKPGSRFILSNT